MTYCGNALSDDDTFGGTLFLMRRQYTHDTAGLRLKPFIATEMCEKSNLQNDPPTLLYYERQQYTQHASSPVSGVCKTNYDDGNINMDGDEVDDDDDIQDH